MADVSLSSGGALNDDFDIVLVLSGGNALGAFGAGVYEALHDNDVRPDWIVGASIGAVNGALIASSPTERRIDALRSFWQPDAFGLVDVRTPWFGPAIETARRTAAAGWTASMGRPGLFGPALSGAFPWAAERPSLFETDVMVRTLERLVDFDELNSGRCRFTATAVDLQTGEDVIFDTREGYVGPQHIRASAALPVSFPPVEIDGRWLVDGGLSANLPLDPVLAVPPLRPTICIAVDLLPLSQALPKTLGEAAGRMQDLVFAIQSRRTLSRWQAAHAERSDIKLTVIRLAYTAQDDEVAGKAFDFSGPTIKHRWAAGYEAAANILARITAGALPVNRAGLNIVES